MSKNNQPKKKRGRPLKYDDAYLKKLADELVAWFKVKNKNNFWLKSFALEKDILPDYFDDFAKRNEYFSLALKKAKALQEKKLVEMGIDKRFDTAMCIFALKNVAGWRDRQSQEISYPQFENIMEGVVNAIASEIKDPNLLKRIISKFSAK